MSPTTPQPDNHRTHGRVKVEHLTAYASGMKMGVVQDLSAGGLRIARRGGRPPEVGKQFMVELRWSDLKVMVPVTVVWTHRTGYLRYRVGLAFDKVSEQMQEQISHLAYVGRTAVLSTRVTCHHERW